MAKSKKNIHRGLDEDTALRTILEGTATKTGEQFFAALVKNLSQALSTHGAWVTEYVEDCRRLRALAFWLGGKWVEDYEYDLAETPCGKVINDAKYVHIQDKAIELFPRDPDLKKMGAVSYAGAPLLDLNGKILGHLAVLDTRPMPEEKRALTIFRIFAARAAAELQRLRAEVEVRQREEKLGGLVNSAMDAIIEIDRNLKIRLANPAAEKVFKFRADQVIDQKFGRFIAHEDREKLLQLIQELEDRSEEQHYMWIAGGLKAIGSDGIEFSAEATLSRFEFGGEPMYVLILRNVNDRFAAEQKIRSLSREAEYLREEIKHLHNFDEIIGQSEPLLRMLHDVEHVAETDVNVLISGETGTGKELIARAIHSASRRNKKPLIRVNCAAIPAALIESEFFGHEKGAFTGATQKRLGRFALADGGTIFLDEIGELSVDLQVKLLRVLQEGEFEPVGSSQTQKVDVRVIAATNRDLQNLVQDGDFREDLYYRLNVFPIEVPPLRNRGDDIVRLAAYFAENFAKRIGRPIEPFSQEGIRRLNAYPWPGNVRELQNVVERAVITSHDGRLNLDRALPETAATMMSRVIPVPKETDYKIQTIKELHNLERENLIRALEACGWRVSGKNGAAQLLGAPPSTLSSRIKALGIKRPT